MACGEVTARGVAAHEDAGGIAAVLLAWAITQATAARTSATIWSSRAAGASVFHQRYVGSPPPSGFAHEGGRVLVVICQ